MRRLRTAGATRASVQAGMKLSQFMSLPESAIEARVRTLEKDEIFQHLLATKVISLSPYANAGLAARRRFGGWGVSTSSGGTAALLEGRGDLAQLLQRVGQERFEACFLRDGGMRDAEIASTCAISTEDAARLRKLVNDLYIQAEFDDSVSTSAPPKIYSTVAGVTVEAERPTLAFFNREIWKGRYHIDEHKRRRMLDAMPAEEAKHAAKILHDLELLDRRKTTLYRLLEILLEVQAEFFMSGDPDKRQPLTQKSVAEKLDTLPSVFHRLISNKSIQLPWGLEAPLRELFPDRKSLLKSRLHDFICEHPTSTDKELSTLIARTFGEKLSRRSVAKYRAELGLGSSLARR